MNQSYQRGFGGLSEVVKNLLIINVLVHIAIMVVGNSWNLTNEIYSKGGLHYFGSDYFQPYQLISHMFMHGGLTHLFFNMYTLYLFGNIIEHNIGSKKFFIFYFVCGIGAAVLHELFQGFQIYQIVGTFLPDAQFGAMNIAVGASGAIMGVLVSFAMKFPNAKLMLIIPPIPIKAKYLVMVFIAFDLIGGFGNFAGDSIAHFAHLGGALAGFLMVKFWNY